MQAFAIPSMKGQVSAAEWQLRCDLAAAYRLLALHGWSDLVFAQISARIPGPEHQFLLNPWGLKFDEITASSLIKVDQACNKISESPFPVHVAGFAIHRCIHEARADAGCVVHTHSRAGAAVSAKERDVLPISQQSTFVVSSLGQHEYEGVAMRGEEFPRLQADLGSNNYLMLRNHGLLTVGKTVADAFLDMYMFEALCRRCLVDAEADCGVNARPSSLDGIAQMMKFVTGGQGASFAWPTLLRRLDPGYRQ
ncbi:class II aldolase/adducin family protein [Variovorax sp. J22R24]|uniref:class II aldolase/adducin family protein n=1 Tax=Variovorax gracilis TaxID=3053502 RepID=UPI002577C39D|nr:class II aldolase/adducin family protein [Variovorax sp. J22R24]MDM0108589.1 class II aldolase/adducin family protein [Variovorax sp. J22R24]